MKSMLLASAILLFSFSLFASEENISEAQVKGLVEKVCAEVKGAADPTTIFKKITAGEHPYKDKGNEALYVFVYNDKVDMIAHPKASLVGKNYKGKPDVKGKNFRDEIVDGALKHHTGWVDYMYQKPGETGIYPKTTYYSLCPNKGVNYIVTAGKYADKK